MKKWISCVTIFMASLLLFACNAVVEQTAENTLTEEDLLESNEQTEKRAVGVIHSVASVPEEAHFTDKWFGTSHGKLLCVDLETKEVHIVWDYYSEEGYFNIQFVHNGNYIYAIGKKDGTVAMWKIDMKRFDREEIVLEQQYQYVAMMCVEQTLYVEYTGSDQKKYVSYKIDEKGNLEKIREEDNTENRDWILHPFYMEDVYGYRLYYEDEENKIAALNSESGQQEYLIGTSDLYLSGQCDVVSGNEYIVIKRKYYSHVIEVISLDQGTIKAIQINGEPYQMIDEWLYYVVEDDIQKQIWRMDVETGEYHQLTIEECKEQRIPDQVVFGTFENGYGVYLYRYDDWQEKNLLARIYNTHVDEIGVIVKQELIQNCNTCGEYVERIDISTIYFEDKTKTEEKLAEAAMKFQQEYVDRLTEEFMLWRIQPDAMTDVMSGHVKDENGFCSRYSRGESSCEADIVYIDKNYLCLAMDEYFVWHGGLHPFGEFDCVTYVRQTGKELYLIDIVDYTKEEWKDVVRTAFIEEGNYVDSDGTVWDSIEEKLGFDMKFALTDEGILIYFDRYEVTDYAGGEPSVMIPYEKLSLKIELHPEQYTSLDPIPD